MKLVVVTVGFDEKLPLRGILKIGIDAGDVVMLVYSKTGGEFEVKKVEKAVEAVKDVISKTGVKVVDVVVSGMNFYGDTTTVLRALREHSANEVVAVLAGGMRLTIFEVLIALLLRHKFSNTMVRVYVMREDGLYDIALPVEAFYTPLTPRESFVLRALYEKEGMKRSKLIDIVSHETGLSESMIYKVTKSLAKRKLVSLEDDTVKLTELGRLVYEAIRKD
ncbi:MAG: CRISPR-associated CARF protein Csa3 [Zestosphaera sp.]